MTERDIFRMAMTDVTPMPEVNRVAAYRPKPKPRIIFKKRHDSTRSGGKIKSWVNIK